MGVGMPPEAILVRVVVAALSLTPFACASSPAPKHADAEQMGVGMDEPDDSGALPRYFTIEVRADGLWLDGERVDDSEVDALLEAAANDSSNRGAAVILYATQPPADALLERVARAGFTHVVVSGLSEESFGKRARAGVPVTKSESAPTETPAVEPKPEPTAEPLPTVQETSSAKGPDDVEVKHYGLHIGGGPNTDEERSKYLDRIEPHFDALRECHLLANKRSVQASFGVDLLIDAKGGRAKVQDYRTRLDGKDFHLCVLGVLGNISFPAPPRPTVVSYSVLFKPAD